MERRWTIRLTAEVGAATPSVVEWWQSPERKEEFLAALVARGMTNCTIEDSTQEPSRIRDSRWTAPTGSTMHQRIESKLGENGRPGGWVGGQFRIVMREVNHVRFASGAEEIVDCDHTLEFTPCGTSRTEIVSTHNHRTVDGRWYHRLLPPRRAHVQMNRELREMASRCELALGARSSGPG